MDFELGSIMAFLTFHALNWSSYLVIIGSLYYLRRRLTNPGLIATQTFDGDLLPLILLMLFVGIYPNPFFQIIF